MRILPAHQRLAELTLKSKSKEGITMAELKEMQQCLDVNVRHVQAAAKFHNLSLLASETDDVEWQHEICAAIDKFEGNS